MSMRGVIQWATVVLVAAVSWGVGQMNLHILNFPLFVGILLLLGLALILVVARTSSPEDLDEPETAQKAADKK